MSFCCLLRAPTHISLASPIGRARSEHPNCYFFARYVPTQGQAKRIAFAIMLKLRYYLRLLTVLNRGGPTLTLILTLTRTLTRSVCLETGTVVGDCDSRLWKVTCKWVGWVRKPQCCHLRLGMGRRDRFRKGTPPHQCCFGRPPNHGHAGGSVLGGRFVEGQGRLRTEALRCPQRQQTSSQRTCACL